MVSPAALLATMPIDFDDLKQAALAEPCVGKHQMCDEYLARHCTYYGNGPERVYVMLLRVIVPAGAHWLGCVMVCDRGELDGQVIPMSHWTGAQVERACLFAQQMVELAGNQPLLRERDTVHARLYVGPHEEAEPVPC